MVTLFVSHGVSDYEKWFAFFSQGMSQLPKESGILETNVYRTLDNGRVVGSHTFSSLEAAEKHMAMLNDPDGQTVASQNGVVLPATIWLVEDVEL